MRTLVLCLAIAPVLTTLAVLEAADIHVSPTGNDANSGTAEQPLASIAAAQIAARELAGREPTTVLLHDGIYYLPETIHFTAEDSGTAAAPVVYTAAPGAKPIISGGQRLALDWTPLGNGVFQAKTPPGLAVDQLFVNGSRQHMARYPNYGANVRHFNGAAADAVAPQRIARWADPAGGYIHAMHAALWGDMHWRILGKKADGSLDYEGGWQNNRPSPMHKEFRFVENIREELDAPGEWFHDARTAMLCLFPAADLDLKTAAIEVVRLKHLVEFNGTKQEPVRFITLRGLTFRHSARTFMDNREPLLRSDWTVYRGGAVVFDGTEDMAAEDCDFDQLGGNAIFVNDYNRRVAVRGCLIREAGANGIAFVGDPKAVRSPLFNYSEKFDYATIDRTPGPLTDNFPADCLVEDCLITRSGRFEKQTAPVQISMAQGITVRHCSICDVPRAGINIGDGCWGGHTIEHCDIFDTVMETGDHGSFNSWGRDRYWHPDVRLVDKQVAADPRLPLLDMVRPTTLRHNRWRCDHGWAIDLDDGSSNYRIYNNLLLNGGLKLREGYQRIVTNNVIVNDSLHPHVWFENSGDVFARNIVMGPYRPARIDVAKWGKEIDRNLFTTSESDRQKFADKGCDANSLVGNPLFLDAAKGDFRVQESSPAVKLGFANFPMDQFGVRSPRLRALAPVPVIPAINVGDGEAASHGAIEAKWKGATLRDLLHYEFSAVGVAADAGGAFVTEAPAGSAAFAAGLRRGDFVQRVSGREVRNVKEFLKATNGVLWGKRLELMVIRNQRPTTLELHATLPKGREYYELRDGLANCCLKFERERAGRIGFLGGSITASSGWRDQVIRYFQERFPQTEFDFISAGISSLGSVPHAFRLQRDVLSRGPVDLLFVEAAVNDTSNTSDANHMLRGMEGVVRHVRLVNPLTDIVHLHFVMPEHMADYEQGIVPVAIAQHEKVAAAYGNATLNLALEVTERIVAGEFTWEEDFKGLHPSPFGHKLYAHSIIRMAEAAFAQPLPEAAKPHPLPDPIDPRSYFRGRFGSISEARTIKGFTLEPSWKPADGKPTRTGFVNVPALVATEPGAEFEFRFDGSGAGLFITSGPDAGRIEFSIDGSEYRQIETFTQWSSSLHLPWAVILDDGLEDGQHTVRVRIAEGQDANGAGTALRVFHLLLN